MADNITAPATGALLATDECVINGVTVQVPRVKVSWGVDGTAVDASATNPLPVAFTGSLGVTGTFWQATQPISAAALPLPSGASTSALQTTMNTSLGLLATAAAQTAGNTKLDSVITLLGDTTTAAPVTATQLPSTIGPKAGSNSLSIIEATNSTLANQAGQASMLAATVLVGTRAYGATTTVATTSSAVTTSALTLPKGEVLLEALTAPCFFKVGTGVTTTTGIHLALGEKFHLQAAGGSTLSVIRDGSTDGVLTITPVA